MLRFLRLHSFLACSLVCLLLAGCSGGQPVTVKGTVDVPATIPPMADTDTGQITFMPEDPGRAGAGASFSSTDKSFTVKGPTGKGVLPGKYKITVQIQPYMGAPGSEQRKAAYELLNNAYDATNSRLTYEVTNDSEQSITIDLGAGMVKRN